MFKLHQNESEKYKSYIIDCYIENKLVETLEINYNQYRNLDKI